MSRPALVAVDDAGALRDVERELRDRYAWHYRVIYMRSSHEARARLEDLAATGDEVASVFAGQWLPTRTTGAPRHGSVKRVASAAGEESVAIQLLHRLFVADRLHPRERPEEPAVAIGR